MIKYTLACSCGHRFDSWFSNWADYDARHAEGSLECPACGGHAVAKTLTAPNIGVGKTQPAPAPSCGAGGCAGGMCPAMGGH